MQKWIGRHGGAHGKIRLFRAQGCDHCGQSGYQGRMGLHELLVADSATKRLIQSRAPLADVRDAAMLAGLRTLRQDGIEKILQGLTDIRQVNAVCSRSSSASIFRSTRREMRDDKAGRAS